MTGNHKYMTGIYQKAEGFNKLRDCPTNYSEYLDFIRFVNIPEIPLHSFVR